MHDHYTCQSPVCQHPYTSKEDNYALLAYLQDLSAESKSRLGPHAFDAATVNSICSDLPGDTHRYIAIDGSSGNIVAYMLLKWGTLEWDRQRYTERGMACIFLYSSAISYPP